MSSDTTNHATCCVCGSVANLTLFDDKWLCIRCDANRPRVSVHCGFYAVALQTLIELYGERELEDEFQALWKALGEVERIYRGMHETTEGE